MIAALLEREAAARPDDPYLQWEDGACTLAEVAASVRRVAAGLSARGVGAGTRVAVLMTSSPEYLYAWFALARLGAVEVPINTAYRGELLRFQLDKARVELCLADTGPLADAVVAVRNDLDVITDHAELLAHGEHAELAADPDELACVIYTSGTTGPSKGVMLTHRHEASFGSMFAHITGLRADDVVLNYSPFFPIAGKFQAIGCLVTGARMLLRRRLSIERFWADAREHGVTVFVAIGGVCQMLFGRPERVDDAENPIRVVYAVPAPSAIYGAFEERFGLKVVEAYGSTETNLVLCTSLEESVPGTCGRPTPGFEVRLVDQEDREVESGEIVVRATDRRLLSAGYDALPEVTEHAWRGGWFHTGDRAVRDEDGRFWFKDRMKDSIRRRGENISSYEVERLVNAHPAVSETAALGAPSELGDEDVRVVVVPRAGRSLEPEALFLTLTETMPYHMVPRFIDVVDELPRTPTDKVEKYKLRSDGLGDGTWDAERAGLRMTRDGLKRS